ncbi:galactose oxidase precursor [Fusarium austroafricanum]|uniref:Galactose oxidase n=1 Tax=Fusarium austroafricanum TaxID=2364996 RepID=A0A8H4NTJ7_9HYPO|nr:galactose oxidase precursor [Fusarium austroafricanum]
MLTINGLGRLALSLALSFGQVDAVAVPNPSLGHIGSSHFAARSAPSLGTTIDRSGWKVTCDSYHQGDECAKAIDGDTNTFWHTEWSDTNNPKPPHTITVDMGSIKNVNSISMLPRQDGSPNGFISGHRLFLSTDGKNWGSPVAFGTWFGDKTQKVSNFETKPARYVRLVALSEANGNPWTSIAELNVYQAGSYTKPAPGIGQWGPTLDFPIVPVAAAVEPTSGKVLVFSSWKYDSFGGSPGSYTLTSIWDPKTGQITQRTVSNTDHDMFCPGISMDGTGEIIVTGGNSAAKTSLYDSPSDSWIPGPDMKIPRGYQSSATLSDGAVFTIGGSWSGGSFEKNGEVYDPSRKTWTLLSNALTKPMLTNDKQGIYRADNHAWLFGWKSGTVFQAGPSTAMNWYYTSGKGDTKSAGKRQSNRGVAPDQMCGDAVMYDAVKGKILTFGGAPSYQDTDATADAHIITIGNPGTQASVVFASNGLWYPRTFHTSVVLPDGTTFITGGQSYGVPFADTTAQLTPELYNPDTDTFYKQQPNSIVRVYHSVALLLPDATVFNGGGGLCGDCNTNHFDAQIFTPAYLLNKDGSRAARPKISSVSQKTLKPGDTLSITTDSAIKSASLVRYGTSTHTVNTDQRRIPLTLRNNGNNKYSFATPSDAGIILPGYWMLFVMNSAGVPSVATTVQVKGR